MLLCKVKSLGLLAVKESVTVLATGQLAQAGSVCVCVCVCAQLGYYIITDQTKQMYGGGGGRRRAFVCTPCVM